MLCWQLLEASYLLQLGYSIQHVYLPLIYYLSCSFGLFPKIYAASHVRWLDLEGLNKIRTRMPFDNVAWEQNDAIAHAWVAELFKPDTLRAIGDFIVKHRRGVPVELCDPKAGAFNVSFRMKFDGGSAVIRFQKPGATMFPEEKVRNEVAVINIFRSTRRCRSLSSCIEEAGKKVHGNWVRLSSWSTSNTQWIWARR